MDDCRFDNVARAIARGGTRRQMLKGLIGGLAGGLAILRPAGDDVQAARRLPAGAPCARGADCASRFCVDSVCCASPCTGQCESCSTGTCSPVSGPPVGNRPACPGSGDCAATCNGQNRTACVFPGAETACGEPACDGDMLTTFTCAGNGTCHPTTTSCGPESVCCAGSCCPAGQECVEGICQVVAICLPHLAECTAADQCCQDEPTGCADVVGCGGSRIQCCRLPGGACDSSCDCCGVGRCVDGTCVASCVDLGEDCTADEHCCVGICDQRSGRCFDPTLAVPCANPIDAETCAFTGACLGCEIDGVCITSCNNTTVACVTETGGANVCVLDAQVVGRGCATTPDCPAGHSCVEGCDGGRGCFPDLSPICIDPGLPE